MITVNTKYFFVLWTIAAIAACNQSAPSDGEVEPEDYYPLIDGATWSYKHSSKKGWEETVTMRQDDEGRYITTDTPNPDGESTESVLVRDGTSVYRVSKNVFLNGQLDFSVAYNPGFLRVDLEWLNKEVGYEDTRQYMRTKTNAGESPKEPRNREHTFVVMSKGKTMNAAGESFRNCLSIKRKKEAVLDETGEVASDEQEKVFWFAPGVGKILEQNLTTGNWEELTSYNIP